MKQIRLFILSLLGLSLFFSCQKDTLAPGFLSDDQAFERSTIVLPAGSVDQLAAALQSASTVILAPGLHTETQMVPVTGHVKIMGQPGAVLRIAAPPVLNFSLPFTPGLSLNNASGTMIMNLTIEPLEPLSGIAIWINSSSKVTIQNCHISGFQNSITVYKSPLASIFNNTVEANPAWQTGQLPFVMGIGVYSGDAAVIERNEISGAFFGCVVADKNGAFRNNILHHNYLGFGLAAFPIGAGALPDGTLIGSDFPATSWNCRNNTAYNNFFTGYFIGGGANHNFMLDNNAYGNARYDIELSGDTNRFGWLSTFCHHNTVLSNKYPNLLIKNCGVNNIVEGGVMVDTALDPCF